MPRRLTGNYAILPSPGFDRMWKDAARRKRDLVAAWSVDRLGRSIADLATFMGDLKACGVGLSLDKQAVDTTVPGGRALLQWLACSRSSNGR